MFCFKHKTAFDVRISDWSSDVCSSDLPVEAEHGVEGEEGHHRHALVGVARARSDEAGHRAGLGDALLEDLSGLRLLVGEEERVVDGLVALTLRRDRKSVV